MQHYSLPTRLLDITTNPLIALYFACACGSPKNDNGEVLVFQVPKREIKYFDSDTVSVVANISRRPSTFNVSDLSKDVVEFNESNAIKLLLHEIRSEKPYFEAKIDSDHLGSVLCVKPKMENARIIRQDGAFFLFGISDSKMEPAVMLDKYVPKNIFSKIHIIAEEKTKVIKQLEALGITQGTIYPEIEHVAEYIKNTYFKKTE